MPRRRTDVARYCSSACRQAAYRERSVTDTSVTGSGEPICEPLIRRIIDRLTAAEEIADRIIFEDLYNTLTPEQAGQLLIDLRGVHVEYDAVFSLEGFLERRRDSKANS